MRRVLLASIVLSAATAAAQEEPPAPPAEEPAAPPLTPDEEGPIAEPQVPEDPMALVPREAVVEAPVPRYEKSDYPVEIVLRPLTLAAEMVELGVDVPFLANDGHPTLTQVLRAAFGATVDLQVGLTWSVGLERLDAQAGEDGFVVGRAFSVDAAYTLIPRWLAAQARLAFHVHTDHFAMGLILGLPFKITIGDRWALVCGADLVRLKLTGFAVDPADPAANVLAVADAERGVASSAGGASFVAGAVYQARPNVALHGTFGVGWPDFDTDDQPFSLFAGVTVSPRRTIDLGARVGFASLDDPGASFAATLSAALRL
jgi:hypothetical protein